MPWFLPLGIVVGVAGTRTASRTRRSIKSGKQEGGWWLLPLLSWFPLVCWLLAQFVTQG